jgi:hypothetical protein
LICIQIYSQNLMNSKKYKNTYRYIVQKIWSRVGRMRDEAPPPKANVTNIYHRDTFLGMHDRFRGGWFHPTKV